MKPSLPHRARRSAPIILTLSFVIIAGLALWYFRPSPAEKSPSQPSVAQPSTREEGSPVAPSQDEPIVAEKIQSEADQPEPASFMASVHQPSSPSALSAPAAPVPSALQPISPPVRPQQSAAEEIAATARMYAAHASLRTPAVADPDSAANMQILQVMIRKALAQSPSAPPASPAAGVATRP